MTAGLDIPPTGPAADSPTGRRDLPRRFVSAAIVAGAVAGAVYLAGHDPSVPGNAPCCPFRTLTGAYCPGCGTLRAIHALSHGDLPAAARCNILTVAAVPLGLWFLLTHAVRAATGRRPPGLRLPAWAGWTVLAIVLLYWILRNMPLEYLTWLRPKG